MVETIETNLYELTEEEALETYKKFRTRKSVAPYTLSSGTTILLMTGIHSHKKNCIKKEGKGGMKGCVKKCNAQLYLTPKMFDVLVHSHTPNSVFKSTSLLDVLVDLMKRYGADVKDGRGRVDLDEWLCSINAVNKNDQRNINTLKPLISKYMFSYPHSLFSEEEMKEREAKRTKYLAKVARYNAEEEAKAEARRERVAKAKQKKKEKEEAKRRGKELKEGAKYKDKQVRDNINALLKLKEE